MKNILRISAMGVLFLSFALTASADVATDPNSATTPQPFSFYCSPYTDPFVSGGEYIPTQNGTCFYTVPLSAPIKVVAIYKGTVGNATAVQFDFTIGDPHTSLRTVPNLFTDPASGDDFFAAAFGAFSGGDLVATDEYLRTGIGDAPAEFAVLAWKWGEVPPPPPPVNERAPLTVTANDVEIVYGDELPVFTATLSGFTGDDTPQSNDVSGSPECSSAATEGSSAGQYPITCTSGTLTSEENYSFGTFVAGTLTITQAPSSVVVSCPSTVTYNGAPQTPCTASVTGAGGLDQPLTINYTNNTAVGTASASASYAGDTNHTGSDASQTFKILYRWDGFLQPINDTAHQIGVDRSVFKAGSTVPVKLQLKDAAGNILTSNVPIIWSTPQQVAAMISPVDELYYSDPITSDNTFDWAGDHYKYNWGTKGKTPGYWYRIYATLPDGSVRSVVIGLR